MYVQCAVRVRAVVRRGTEERSFGICRGKVDAHNRTVAYGRSTGIYEHVQIYIGEPGGRPITFLPLSRAQRECGDVCMECEREGVRACMMNAHIRYTEQLRMKSEAVCEKRGRKDESSRER